MQIEDSPSLDSDRPVSRQFESTYYDYYQYPSYWNGAYVWGAYPFFVQGRHEPTEPIHSEKVWDYHLRSTQDVTGHHVQAIDGEIGHVSDFILDVDNWTIRYLIVDTTCVVRPHLFLEIFFPNQYRIAHRTIPEWSFTSC